jgi:ABC-type glycerol-3-phosphate transport system permease component
MSTRRQTSWWMQQRRLGWLRIGLLSIIAFALALPLMWTLLASFGVQPVTPPFGWAWPPMLEHYSEVGVADPNFWWALATTSVIAALATCLTVMIALLAAYSLVRARFRGRHLLLQSFLILASLPVMAYVIPLSDIMRRLHGQDTVLGLVLAQTAVYAPLATYILFGYLARLPLEVEEAAQLDGAGLLLMLQTVVLPSAAPGIAATAIIVFVFHWNTLLVPLVLTNGNIKTIPVIMSDFFTFERELEWPTAAAALITSLVPLTLIVTLAYRTLAAFGLATNAEG